MEALKPKLRFPEFEGNWEENVFENLVKINQGLQIPISERFLEEVENSYFYITNEFLKEGSQKKYFIKNPTQSVLCTEDDILMTRTGNTGMVVTNVKGAFHNNFFKIQFPENINKGFLYYFLVLDKTQNLIKSLAGTSTIPDLNHSDFYKIEFIHPSQTEQAKIANFLSSIDEKINLLKEKKALLEEYKKGMMQKIFNQEIRFKDDNGNDFEEWNCIKLKDILTENKTRNKNNTITEVFSVAKSKGVINQIEHLGRSYASENISNYKVVFENDLVYTKSPTSDFPYGIIKQNKLQRKGVVSVLYGIFTPVNKSAGLLLDYYFSDWKNTYNYLDPIIQKGAKNTINIGNDTFLNGEEIVFPIDLKEQIKIANFLSAIDEKISLVATQIEDTQEYKKGLLQEMFV